MGSVWNRTNSNSGEAKCGTRPENGIHSAICWINSYSITGAPAKSVTYMMLWWCIYVTKFWTQSKGIVKPGQGVFTCNTQSYASQECKISYNCCRRVTMQCDLSHEVLHQRVQGSIRAIRAISNTRVFLMETRVVADGPYVFGSTYYGKYRVPENSLLELVRTSQSGYLETGFICSILLLCFMFSWSTVI